MKEVRPVDELRLKFGVEREFGMKNAKYDEETLKELVLILEDNLKVLKYTPFDDLAFSYLNRVRSSASRLASILSRKLRTEPKSFCIVIENNLLRTPEKSFLEELGDVCDCPKSKIGQYYSTFTIDESTDLKFFEALCAAERIAFDYLPVEVFDYYF